MKYIMSAIIWVLGFSITAATFVVSWILSVILPDSPKKERIIHSQCFWWSDALMALNPYWKLKVSGLENIDPSKVYVIVANHESLGDIIVIYKMHMQFKWIAKESLLKIPFLGGLLWINKHIMLSRGSFGSIKEVYRKAAERLRSGMSVLFFRRARAAMWME
ncbi:MAG: lysophospholipid acyltransferase family protein [Candidatus Omnitrophota bacterium]